MRILSGTILAVALAIPLAARADTQAAPEASPPEEVVQRATASHLDVLAGLVDKVPEPAREKIRDAINISRRGGEKALEALRKSHMDGGDVTAPTTSAQARGLKRAIQAIDEATGRATSGLETALGHVPESAAQAIKAINSAIDRIEASHAEVLLQLEGLLARGVSTAHPPERPDAGTRPENVRPERPEGAGSGMRPEVVRPARPVLPDHPARP